MEFGNLIQYSAACAVVIVAGYSLFTEDEYNSSAQSVAQTSTIVDRNTSEHTVNLARDVKNDGRAVLNQTIAVHAPDVQTTHQYEGPVHEVMTLVARLAKGDKQSFYFLKRELDTLTLFRPELVDVLLMEYINLSDQNMKEELYALLTTTTNDALEKSLLDKLERGENEHALEWLDLLATMALQSDTSTNRLVTLLQSATDADQTQLILQVLYAQGDLMPDDQAAVLANIVNLSSHPDNGIRAAAIGALPFWQTSYTGYIVEHAIQDSSVEVRMSAIRAAHAVSNQTPFVQFSLIEIAKDEQELNKLRHEAISALAGFSLNQFDRKVVSNLRVLGELLIIARKRTFA